MMIHYHLEGRVPSKKNSKQIVPNRSGKGRPYFLVSSKKHKAWHQDATAQLLNQPPIEIPLDTPVREIELVFTFGDKRKTDLTNKAESIMDLLVDNKVIKDDNWMEIPHISLKGQYEKGVFGCNIYIMYERKEENGS